jgi:hypothetical protein
VDLYGFFSWCLTVMIAVTLVWPLNVPLMALAYKIRQGGQKIDMESREFWWRSVAAALGLTGLSLVTMGLTWYLVGQTELRAGIVHLILFMVYLPAAVWFVYWIYALYILVPALPLLLAGRLFGLWPRLRDLAPWLLPPA